MCAPPTQGAGGATGHDALNARVIRRRGRQPTHSVVDEQRAPGQ